MKIRFKQNLKAFRKWVLEISGRRMFQAEEAISGKPQAVQKL